MIDTLPILHKALDVTLQAVKLKERILSQQLRRAVVREVHLKQFDQAERDLSDALFALMKRQGRAAARRLLEIGGEKSVKHLPGQHDQMSHGRGGVVLPAVAANRRARQRRDEVAETRVPKELIPSQVYIGMRREWAEDAMKQGIDPGKKGQLGHDENRADSIYVASTPERAQTYANMYSDTWIVRVDVGKLDLNSFYYDPLDFGSADVIQNPQQLAYRGSIPADAISREKSPSPPQTKSQTSFALAEQILNPRDWDAALVDTVFPTLLKNAGEAASAQMLLMGVDVTRGRKKSVKHLLGQHDQMSHGSGGGGSRIDVVDRASLDKAKKFLGINKMSDDELASLGGAVGNAQITISTGSRDDGAMWIDIDVKSDQYLAIRTLGRFDHKADGDLVLQNHSMKVIDKGKGLGTQILVNQVDAAISSGVSKITLHAVGSAESRANGYYTWPRLGFDGELAKADMPDWKMSEAKEKFGATKVSDLMKTAEGRSWWKENGGDIFGSFDLKEGSQSRRVLDEYAKEKADRGSKSAGTGRSGRGDFGQNLGQDRQRKSQTSFALAEQILNPRDWDTALVDTVFPTLLKNAGEAASAQMLLMGVDVTRGRKKSIKRGDGVWVGPESTPNYHALRERIKQGKEKCDKCGSKSNLLVHHIDNDGSNDAKPNLRVLCDPCHRALPHSKATTATEWLDNLNIFDLPSTVFDTPLGEVSMGFMTEWPEWMKKVIVEQARESFEQPFWAAINDTTLEGIDAYIRAGLENGESIANIAKSMVDDGLDEYYHGRAKNIARTESGNALNGARKVAMDQLAEEVPGLVMQKTWMSVLGTTTRDTHANLDGVPEGPDGMWELGGVRVPWPSHYWLPVGERANCQCSLVHSWGMADTTAEQLIAEYNERLVEEKQWRKHLAGQHDQSSHGRGGGGSTRDEQLQETSGVGKISNDSVKSDNPLKGGANTSRLLEIENEDGTIQRSVFKPIDGENPRVHPAYYGRQANAEVASAVVDDAMGLGMAAPSKMVEVGGKVGSLSDYINDTAKIAADFDDDTLVKAKGVSDMLHYDVLIGNSDRHLGNWLIRDGEVKLIDNGMAFAENAVYDDPGLRFRGLEHLPKARAFQPMSQKFKAGLEKMIDNAEAVDKKLQDAGLSSEQRRSFWARADYLRRAGSVGFGNSTLRDISRLSDGLDIF